MTLNSVRDGKGLNARTRGRLLLLSLVLLFAIPAIAAKIILLQQWYQPGVTNRGELIEPKLTYSMVFVDVPEQKSWHFGYLVPEVCGTECKQQLHLLRQSYSALGKYQPRVTPVLYLSDSSADIGYENDFALIEVGDDFTRHINAADIVLVDPLGQLVMRFEKTEAAEQVSQSKDILFDFRKLLKLSRVG